MSNPHALLVQWLTAAAAGTAVTSVAASEHHDRNYPQIVVTDVGIDPVATASGDRAGGMVSATVYAVGGASGGRPDQSAAWVAANVVRVAAMDGFRTGAPAHTHQGLSLINPRVVSCQAQFDLPEGHAQVVCVVEGWVLTA